MGQNQCCQVATGGMSECVTSITVGPDKENLAQNKTQDDSIHPEYFDDGAISDNIRDYEKTFSHSNANSASKHNSRRIMTFDGNKL